MKVSSKILRFSTIIIVVLVIIGQLSQLVSATGCTDNESCTALCGFAGAGTCVDGKYCKCADCPMRNAYSTVTNWPKLCTMDPATCSCDGLSSLSRTSGKMYFPHSCAYGTSMVCICFCMPTTLEGLKGVMYCPVPKIANSNGNSTTTTTATPTANPITS